MGPKPGSDPQGSIHSFNPGGQYIMLTFEGSPHSILTPMLLDLFKKTKVKATFFVLGSKAFNQPELLRRMVTEGHEVALHGWNHVSYLKMDVEKLHHQLMHSKMTIENATTKHIAVVRPPFGSTNVEINKLINDRLQAKVILWSLDSKDLEIKDPQIIANNIVNKAKPGDVIRCHDGSAALLEAMPSIVEKLYKAGYEFLTLSQVISFPDDSPH
jgi:peptidoglycan/xylan/chitin deacetylase (PgdA/CDA1 family)